jgi:hypothetical protein
MKRLGIILFALAACLFTAQSAVAQFETASVLGYVRDSSGAVVPGAKVSLQNTGTKAAETAVTNAQGAYEFTSVKVGDYQVSASANGFDTGSTSSFHVDVNARQRVDIALKIGLASETVTVTDAASLLETDSSERGQVINTREVENLPLNGRSYADLAALVPGVRRNILENSTDSSRDASFNVNGQRSEFNNFLLDGLDNNAYGTSNQGFSNQAIPPSPDAISQFKVETDNYSAEYGRSAGAVINVSIRSGTNQFHGKAYEYIRNTVLNAIGPFTPPTNAITGTPQKPVLIRNQFGGTFGGPVLHDKLFFFADYEGTRQVARAITNATVPTANQAGTSTVAKTNGGYTFIGGGSTESGTAVPLINPLTGTVYTNGVVPFNDPSVSTFAKGVLAALPAPNVPGSPFQNNFASLPLDGLHDDKGDIRLDYTRSEKTTGFFRYSEHKGIIQAPPNIPGPAGGNSNGNVNIFNQQYAGGVTHAFTQNAIIDARFAYTHTDGGKSPFGANLPSLETGISGLPTDPRVVRSLNVQSVSGYSQFGNQGSNPQFQNPTVYNPKVNFTLLRGRSQYKFGYEYQAINTEIDDFNPTYGQDTYNGYFSYGGSAQASKQDTGTKEAAAFADFLFGARDSYQLNNFVVVHLNQRMNYFYVQDDIRVTSKLTVNAGLRYELVTPQWESNNLLANYSPSTQSLVQASNGSIYSRALVNMPMLDFAPRIGLAYQANPRTVVRAAYGLSFAQFNREGGENLLVYNLPNIVNTNLVQVPQFALSAQAGSATQLATCTSTQAAAPYNSSNPTPCFRTSSQGYPTGLTSVPTTAADLNARDLNTQARYIPANLPTGYVQAWHLTVQRELGPSTTLEVSYVGEHGVKLQVLADLNQAVANPVTATCNATTASTCLTIAQRRPIQTFTTIEETLPAGFLAYNGLQTKVEHRTAHGLYLLDSFTYSRAQDNASGHLDTPDGDNSRVNTANLLGDRGVSAYNQPLNNVLTVVYDLPFGKGRMFGNDANRLLQEALGGWQVTAIDSASSGLPINVNYSPNSAQLVSTLLTQRPNQNYGVNPVIPKGQRVKLPGNQAFIALNAAAFSLPSNNQPYGNASRNSVRFDPFYQLDLGLHKTFDLYPERVKFDFRAEAFNVLNQTNYGFASSNLSSGFGTVVASETFPARILQFAGKFVF